jgi:hypothetical protein
MLATDLLDALARVYAHAAVDAFLERLLAESIEASVSARTCHVADRPLTSIKTSADVDSSQ